MDVFKYLGREFPKTKEFFQRDDARQEEEERIASLFENFAEDEDVIFDSWVIQNYNYLKYRSLRKAVFLFFFFIATPMFALLITNESRQVLIDDIFNPESSFRLYYIVNLIGIVLYSFLHYLTWNQKTTGQMAFTISRLVVEDHGTTTEYMLDEAQYVEISRGTTFHMDDPAGVRYTGDNHVVIKKRNGEKEVFEFKIEDKEHSEELDELVKCLRINLGKKFIFKSI